MQCMLQMGGRFSHCLLMGGHQDTLVEYDLTRGEMTNCVSLLPSPCELTWLYKLLAFIQNLLWYGIAILYFPHTFNDTHKSKNITIFVVCKLFYICDTSVVSDATVPVYIYHVNVASA